jgi:hypothetical protein
MTDEQPDGGSPPIGVPASTQGGGRGDGGSQETGGHAADPSQEKKPPDTTTGGSSGTKDPDPRDDGSASGTRPESGGRLRPPTSPEPSGEEHIGSGSDGPSRIQGGPGGEVDAPGRVKQPVEKLRPPRPSEGPGPAGENF